MFVRWKGTIMFHLNKNIIKHLASKQRRMKDTFCNFVKLWNFENICKLFVIRKSIGSPTMETPIFNIGRNTLWSDISLIEMCRIQEMVHYASDHQHKVHRHSTPPQLTLPRHYLQVTQHTDADEKSGQCTTGMCYIANFVQWIVDAVVNRNS